MMTRFALMVALSACGLTQQPSPQALEPNGDSGSPSISDDGKFVVFESRASNFVAGDQKDTWDVFLFERATGRVTRISDETPLPARTPRISGDGRWVVYLQAQAARAKPPGSRDSTEVPWKVALVNRQEHSTRWLGDAASSFETAERPSPPSIARDGSRVVFQVTAHGEPAILVYDAIGPKRALISATKENKKWPVGLHDPFLGASGHYLVFTAAAEDMDLPIPVPTKGFDFDDDRHVFRRELATGRTEYVSHLGLKQIGYGDFGNPRVSDEGRFVSYDNFNPGRMGSPHVGFVSDVTEHMPGRLVAMGAGESWWQGPALITWLSSDGRVALVNTLSPLVSAIPAGCEVSQIVIRDLEASTWTLASRSLEGAPANRESFDASAADDRSIVAYASEADNLVPSDKNKARDIFIVDCKSGKISRVEARQ